MRGMTKIKMVRSIVGLHRRAVRQRDGLSVEALYPDEVAWVDEQTAARLIDRGTAVAVPPEPDKGAMDNATIAESPGEWE